jgi:hypothetical protein
MHKKPLRKELYFLFFIFTLFFFASPTFSQSIPVVSNAEILDKSTGLALPSLSKGGLVRFHVDVSDLDGIKYVRAIIKDLGSGNLSSIVSLYDDGKDDHGDSPSFVNGSLGEGDGKYSAIWLTPSSLNSGSSFAIIIEAADIFGNVYRSDNNAIPFEDTFSVEESCIFGFTCLPAELGNFKCGGNIIQQCVFDPGDNCNFWDTSTDCGLNVCCGLGAGAVCCGVGEICGAGGACVTCSDTTCNGICLDSSCTEDPDCSVGGCCGDGNCSLLLENNECNSCSSDCVVADCCGNGVCNSDVGENYSNCVDCPCLDEDGDGYLSIVCLGLDCDDTNSEINPSKDEICDGIDNDCDVTTVESAICDNDADNYCNCDRVYEYGSNLSLICSGTNTTNAFWWNKTCDCNDLDFDFKPNILEQCDGIDNNCDGIIDDGCACVEGVTQECGSDLGICEKGNQTCSAGSWGSCVGDVTPQAEVCNGLDDNCDDVVDNNLAPELNDNTWGVCAGTFKVCNGSSMQNDYLSILNYEADETTCDGLDNDCDNDVDEGCTCIDNAVQSCGTNLGECQQGTQTCLNNSWGECIGEIVSSLEICDGLDNDCDSEVDEGCNKDGDNYCDCGMPYSFGSNLAALCSGTNTTDALAIANTCDCSDNNWGINPGATESCDGDDNNCNSIEDEGCNCVDGSVQPCGSDVGECQAGTQTCVLGNWGPCTGEITPSAEVCNGLDDNCDNGIDNGLPPVLNTIQDGICLGSEKICGGIAGWQDGYTAISGYQLTETICDGLDNDCDATNDENCNNDGDNYCACGLQYTFGSNLSGTCLNTDSTNLFTVLATCDCNDNNLAIYPNAVEACDGINNDCDGTTDEGCNCIDATTQPCGSDVGECQSGIQTCVGGNWGVCVGEIAPTGEICNGLDDNCDNLADNGLTPPLSDDQDGVCLSSVKECNGLSGWENNYASLPNYQANETTCDGLNNDCDITTDEGCNCIDDTIQSCGTNIGECQTGNQICVLGNWGPCNGEVGPVAEVCDGLNNDCDATTDEGCLCVGGTTQPCGSDIGQCQAGTQTCSAGNWGVCVGEIGSTAEVCDDVVDNDCDGFTDFDDSDCVDVTPPSFWSLTFPANSLYYKVSDAGGSHLERIEVWRAPDNAGAPGVWSELTSLENDISGLNSDLYETTLSYNIPGDITPGIWWHEIRIFDKSGNSIAGPSALSSSVFGCTPDGCNGTCPVNCSVLQDADCGCSDNNGCCGTTGCTNLNDNDCAPPPCLDERVDINQDGSFSQCGCASTNGYVCDINEDSIGDGLCNNADCVTSPPLALSCGDSCGTEDTFTNPCFDFSGWACDNDFVQGGQTFFEQDGICASIAGSPACATSGHVCKSGITFYNGCNNCSDGDPCDINITQGNFDSTYGVCNTGACQEVTIPAIFDWRDYMGGNWMSPIRNQGACGSCWAFNTIAVAEAKWNIQQGDPDLDIDLSEQYMVSGCCGAGDCDGGWQAFNCGTTNETCYPYQTANSACGGCGNISNEMWDISDYSMSALYGSAINITTRETVKTMLMTNGPLWMSMGDAATGSSFIYSPSDSAWVCTNDDSRADDLNHGVTLVGWNEPGGYWIVRNSWGVGWGFDGGYFNLKYDECLFEVDYYLNSVVAP